VGNKNSAISTGVPEEVYLSEIETAIDEIAGNRFRIIHVLTATYYVLGNVFAEMYDRGYRNGDFVVFTWDIHYLVDQM
jgi:hypothetical protein